MRRWSEMIANVCRKSTGKKTEDRNPRADLDRSWGTLITSSSTYPLHHSFHLVVGWRFARDHPLVFRAPIHHRPQFLAGATFSPGADRGGVRL